MKEMNEATFADRESFDAPFINVLGDCPKG